jgi:hypothetical protein
VSVCHLCEFVLTGTKHQAYMALIQRKAEVQIDLTGPPTPVRSVFLIGSDPTGAASKGDSP